MSCSDSNNCFRHSGACAAGNRSLVAVTSGFRFRARWRPGMSKERRVRSTTLAASSRATSERRHHTGRLPFISRSPSSSPMMDVAADPVGPCWSSCRSASCPASAGQDRYLRPASEDMDVVNDIVVIGEGDPISPGRADPSFDSLDVDRDAIIDSSSAIPCSAVFQPHHPQATSRLFPHRRRGQDPSAAEKRCPGFKTSP